MAAELPGVREVIAATAGDGGLALLTADQARADEDVDFVDGAAVEKAAQDFGASLDKQVGPAASAEFIEERGPI